MPLSKPYASPLSRELVIDTLGQLHQQGDGKYSELSTKELVSITETEQTLLTPSCTSSLEIASMLIGLMPGDEVVMPSFNFTSAATAVTKFGATPVFVDVEARGMCVDSRLVENAITKKTKAITWVNYAGYLPNTDHLQSIAQKYNLFLVEDNAHGLGTYDSGRKLGSAGDFVTYSFHATKNVQCGEGGAITIKDEELYRRAKVLREKGTNRSDFLDGLVDKYSWVDLGSSYLLSELQASLLYGNLLDYSYIQEQRRMIFERYCVNLDKLAKRYPISGEFDSHNEKFAYHLIYILMDSEDRRTRLIDFMRFHSITTAFHYQSLHSSTAGNRYGRHVGKFTNSDLASKQLLRLPIYVGMSLAQVDKVCSLIEEFFQN